MLKEPCKRFVQLVELVPLFVRFIKLQFSGIAEQAAKGTWATTKVAAGIGLNVFFIGLDIFTIVTDSISLASGEKSEVSEFIRDRVAILRSELDCWTRIHSSVGTARKKLESGKEVLQKRCDCSSVDFN